MFEKLSLLNKLICNYAIQSKDLLKRQLGLGSENESGD